MGWRPSGTPSDLALIARRSEPSLGAVSPVITSTHNKRVAKAVRLKKRAMREKDRRFLVEGAQAVREAIACEAAVGELFHSAAAGAGVRPVIDMARERRIPVSEVSEEVMGRLTSTVTPQGLVAVADFVDVPLSAISGDART